MISLIVGTTLTLINQGTLLVQGILPPIWKVGLTYLVPYLVSTYGAVSAMLAARRAKEAAGQGQGLERQVSSVRVRDNVLAEPMMETVPDSVIGSPMVSDTDSLTAIVVGDSGIDRDTDSFTTIVVGDRGAEKDADSFTAIAVGDRGMGRETDSLTAIVVGDRGNETNSNPWVNPYHAKLNKKCYGIRHPSRRNASGNPHSSKFKMEVTVDPVAAYILGRSLGF